MYIVVNNYLHGIEKKFTKKEPGQPPRSKCVPALSANRLQYRIPFERYAILVPVLCRDGEPYPAALSNKQMCVFAGKKRERVFIVFNANRNIYRNEIIIIHNVKMFDFFPEFLTFFFDQPAQPRNGVFLFACHTVAPFNASRRRTKYQHQTG